MELFPFPLMDFSFRGIVTAAFAGTPPKNAMKSDSKNTGESVRQLLFAGSLRDGFTAGRHDRLAR